ncbi:hypothetical protein [Streptomyces rubrogriseus]|uniref:Tetracyclin repressor-like C-terminal domain-containing protein n=1 Tax=Streptomyces rubrogriseus TaxID=194673 RepID=A0A6G3TEG2_9ACTN|nr:hypothetical protein [Streptomyces rubrogriseus]NEC34698.1 hypothetical protein [Streptomyces rubrogriseus]
MRAVTLSDIAALTGINKSAVRRYVEIREGIYLRHRRVLATVSGRVAGSAGVADGTTGEVATALWRTPVCQPLLCGLLTHAALLLGRHVSAEAVLAYSMAAHAGLDDMTQVGTRFQALLGEDAALEIIGTVSLLAGALWQLSVPPEVLARLLRQEARLAQPPSTSCSA